MKLTYIYHSCYLFEGVSADVLIDFYEDSSSIDGIIQRKIKDALKPLYILSTHSHHDHFNSQILSWKKERGNIIYIFSKEILDSGLIKNQNVDFIYLDKLETYVDKFVEIMAFGSTDIGSSFLLKLEEKLIFHAGDLNNWHWNEESTEEESLEYEQNYLNELDILVSETDTLDLAMLPIDPRLGQDYAKGTIQFLERINTKLVAPMHFHDAYDKIVDIRSNVEVKGSKLFIPLKRGDNANI